MKCKGCVVLKKKLTRLDNTAALGFAVLFLVLLIVVVADTFEIEGVKSDFSAYKESCEHNQTIAALSNLNPWQNNNLVWNPLLGWVER